MARREIVEQLDRLSRTTFRGTTYRHLSWAYAPISGEGARVNGGRWNPPESFPVLYTSPSLGVIVAEIRRTAARTNVAPENLLPRRLVRYEVATQRMLDLTDADNLAPLGLTHATITGDDVIPTRAIGEAAHYVGFEGIVAPSAAARGITVSIFIARLVPGSVVRIINETNVESLDALLNSGEAADAQVR